MALNAALLYDKSYAGSKKPRAIIGAVSSNIVSLNSVMIKFPASEKVSSVPTIGNEAKRKRKLDI